MAKAQAKGVRVVLTVERMSWDTKGRARTVKLLSNPAARTRLANEIATELMATGADGVNLDFEPMPPRSATSSRSSSGSCESVLDAARPGLQITFDITASVPTYDIAALTADDAADAVFLMAYDFIGNSADHAASHSPLDDPVNHFDIRTTVAELLGGGRSGTHHPGSALVRPRLDDQGTGGVLADAERQEPDRTGVLLVRGRRLHRTRQRPQLGSGQRVRVDRLCPEGLRYLPGGMAPGLV